MPSSNYTLYGTGSNYVGLDSASRMCLSCHDGTVAIDSYGSGGSVHTGTIKLGAANDINGNSTAGFVVGGGGDLTHDHPVGLTYPGLSADGKTWTTSSGFKDPTKFTSKSYYTSTQNPDGSYVTASYVNDSGASISAVGGSVISLQNGNVIGCVACHTPHNNEYNFLHIPNTNSQLCLTCHDR
jgi:predicted CXXCH cytochrome family protein